MWTNKVILSKYERALNFLTATAVEIVTEENKQFVVSKMLLLLPIIKPLHIVTQRAHEGNLRAIQNA